MSTEVEAFSGCIAWLSQSGQNFGIYLSLVMFCFFPGILILSEQSDIFFTFLELIKQTNWF